MMEQLKHEIDIFWSEEDEGYIADVPDLKYCLAWGETYEEALQEIRAASWPASSNSRPPLVIATGVAFRAILSVPVAIMRIQAREDKDEWSSGYPSE